jgi:hypothetical protein
MGVAVDLKIDVTKGKKRGPAKQTRPRPTNWPTAPFEEDDPPKFVLDLEFFDGSTEPSKRDDSGFRVMPCYRGTAVAQADQTRTTLDYTFRFLQNTYSVSAADIQQTWTAPTTSEQDSESTRDILSRRPLEKVDIDCMDNNDDVFPCGALTSNIEVVLVDDSGVDQGSVDAISIIKSEVVAFLNPDAEGMAYRWFRTPPGTHIRVRERTCMVKYLYVDGGYGPLYQDGGAAGPWVVPVYGAEGAHPVLEYYWEGPFWNWFDTSDTTNFKLTKVPKFACEASDEYTEPVIKLIAGVNKYRVFLIPRVWWSYLRFADGKLETIYGVWDIPDRDFEMPSPRKDGKWETSHYWSDFPAVGGGGHGGSYLKYENGDLSDESFSLGNSNWQMTFAFTGDSRDSNSFYILHRVCPQDVYVEDDLGGTKTAYSDHLAQTKFADVGPTGEYYGTNSATELRRFYGLPLVLSSGYAYNEFGTLEPAMTLYPTSYRGFWGSVADCKVPDMARLISVVPGDGNYAYWNYGTDIGLNAVEHLGGGYASRVYRVHDSALIKEADRDKISELVDFFAGHTFCNRAGETPDSWFLGSGSAKAEDLVGVIEIRGELIFVWRRTIEKPRWSAVNEEPMCTRKDNGETDLVLGAIPLDGATYGVGGYRHSSIAAHDIKHCNRRVIYWIYPNGYTENQGNFFGHIEFGEYAYQLTDAVHGESGIVPRVRYWGAWTEATMPAYGSVDPVRGTEHKNQIDLGRYVMPVAYVHNDRDNVLANEVGYWYFT